MYKIFIDNSNNELIKTLSKKVQDALLAHDNCIVYNNSKTTERDDIIDNVELDAYIYIQERASTKGPEVILDEENKFSNGIAKEVYKEIRKIYHDKQIDKGLVYKKNVFNSNLNSVPSIIINIIDINNSDDIKWLEQGIEEIALAISRGIMISFELKLC